MGHVDVGDMRMHYDEYGPDDGSPVVLMHGGGGASDDPIGGWAALVPLFAEAHRVVTVDHRGHGRTANPAGYMTFEQMGDDLTVLLNHLEFGPVHLAGISDGGVVALDQALRRPQTVRTVAVVGTNYCVDELTLAAAAGLDVDAIERDMPELAATLAARHDEDKRPGFWKELVQQIADNNAVNPTWTPDDLRRIACPTLLIAGERDPFANFDQLTMMRREIPNSEWLVLNASGHAVHAEHPGIVGPRLIDFWSRHDVERSS